MDAPPDNEHIYMQDNSISFGREAPRPEKPRLNYKEDSKTFSAQNGEAISKMNGKLRIVFAVMVISVIVTFTIYGVQSYGISKLNIQNIDLNDETMNAASTLERNLMTAAEDLKNEYRNASRILERDLVAALNDVRDETRNATSTLENNLMAAAKDLKNESRNATGRLERNFMAAVNVLRDHLDKEIANCKRDLLEYTNKANAYDERFNSTYFTNCRRVFAEDAKKRSESGGVFDIYLRRNKTEVFCDLETDAGGWTVFQRRMDGSENFYRGWDDYVHGFGNLTGEFWMGLETLHRMTATSPQEMRVDLEAWDNEKRYAKYSTFYVGNLESKYAIRISGHSGTAADSISRENGRPFTTKDTADHRCATAYQGAWWYGECHEANLNGIYYKTGPTSPYGIGVNWRNWKGYYYSMKRVEMKIRPLNL